MEATSKTSIDGDREGEAFEMSQKESNARSLAKQGDTSDLGSHDKDHHNQSLLPFQKVVKILVLELLCMIGLDG